MPKRRFRGQEFVASFDRDRMTAQDETVWNEIFKTLAE